MATSLSDLAIPAGSVSLGTPTPTPTDKSRSRSSSVTSVASSLPALPIPKLDGTLDKFLTVLEPLLDDAEMDEARAAVEKFRSGDGPVLQAALEEWTSKPGNRSYIEKFWFDAYLKPRSGIAIRINPFFVLEEDPTPSRNSQIERAASLIHSCLKFHQALLTGSLEADTARGTPLCMSQYKDLFHTTRIPSDGPEGDSIARYPESRHIVTMCRGLHYWFNVYSADGKYALGQEEIAANLRLIREDAWSLSSEECYHGSIGVMTGDNRTQWARVRKEIEARGESGIQSLRVVDSALFVVCLDHVSPHSLAEQSQNCLSGTYALEAGLQVGTCLNRWYDKSLQLIVCENGSAGVNFEHSHLDGHTVLRFASDVFTDTILRFAQTIRGGLPSVLGALSRGGAGASIDSSPKKVVWDLSRDTRHKIVKAEAALSDLVCQVELQCLEFSGFGKAAIVAEKCSPDAFVQLSIQLAYYRLYGELRSTYETVMTKMYDHGRTEAQRSCTTEALEFCQTFCSEASNATKVAAFRTAMGAQVRGVKACAAGLGVDRHLFALSCVAKERGMALPELYSTTGYATMTHNVISTSNCGNPSLRLFGFAPVVADGYGIGYLIKNDGVQFCVSSFRRQTSRFIELLRLSLIDIRTLLATEHVAAPIDPMPAGSVTLGSRSSGAGPGGPAPASVGSGAGAAVPPSAASVARRTLGSSGGYTREFSLPRGFRSSPSAAPAGLQVDTVLQMWETMLASASSPVSKTRVLSTIAATAGIAPPVSAAEGVPPSDTTVRAWLGRAASHYASKMA